MECRQLPGGAGACCSADNQLQYLGVLSNTFNLNSSGDFLDDYYDDNGWWANAWIFAAYDLTGNTNFLAMAKTIFTNLLTGWDSTNTSCPGGLWWSTGPLVPKTRFPTNCFSSRPSASINARPAMAARQFFLLGHQ